MSHAYDSWADGNLDPQPFPPLPVDLDAAERDACLNTLKDVVRLTDEDLPAAEALFRIRTIALATLRTFEDAEGPEKEESFGAWFEDDPPDSAA
jgi:hypothetical protein